MGWHVDLWLDSFRLGTTIVIQLCIHIIHMEMCYFVGYCGADIKSICAEATLSALRRRYPQIYTSSAKLQLDISSINITAKDFVVAMQKTIPASQRAVTSPGQALSTISKPLLESTLQRILEVLQTVFPHSELAQKGGEKSGICIWISS